MALPHSEPEQEEAVQRIISPFAQTSSTVRPQRSRGSSPWPLRVVSALLILLVVGLGGYFINHYLNDPYRTLEVFPVDKYFSDFHSMSGNKFKADLKVVADLGWKDTMGRLMVFNAGSESRPVVVLIPPKLSGIYFTKGQTYQAALEVGEGGLIYADSCQKE